MGYVEQDGERYYTEFVVPGAFDRTLRENREVLCLVDHDSRWKLGSTAEGTLELTTDALGLKFRCQPKPKDVKYINWEENWGCSIGFSIIRETWARNCWSDNHWRIERKRSISDVDLHEVTITTHPANHYTWVRFEDGVISGYAALYDSPIRRCLKAA